eukprot:COSAG05_NODE_3173_length_2268_cov_0.937759_2_plen_128_part_00
MSLPSSQIDLLVGGSPCVNFVGNANYRKERGVQTKATLTDDDESKLWDDQRRIFHALGSVYNGRCTTAAAPARENGAVAAAPAREYGAEMLSGYTSEEEDEASSDDEEDTTHRRKKLKPKSTVATVR